MFCRHATTADIVTAGRKAGTPMNLKKYFDEHIGFGVLSRADQDGRVDAAVYARPHCFDDGTERELPLVGAA
jgi:hypothetical protein